MKNHTRIYKRLLLSKKDVIGWQKIQKIVYGDYINIAEPYINVLETFNRLLDKHKV